MFITPNWPAPKQVKAFCTTRKGGKSLVPFDSFNLALHVGDEPDRVAYNRQNLIKQAKLPSSPVWLDQQHTDVAVALPLTLAFDASQKNISPPMSSPVADASWTTQKGCVCVVMTADCLPLLVTNQSGTLVAAIHAGWKGLQKGIVSKTIQGFLASNAVACHPGELMVWIGPAISAAHFEVGQAVFDAFVNKDARNRAFFTDVEARKDKEASPKYLADLVGLVSQELQDLGIDAVYGGDLCTYSQPDSFYSYRRSGQIGRMASLIWIDS